MNKYQEALDFLSEYSLGCAVTNHKEKSIITINKYKKHLQELVDKETPANMVGVLHNGLTYGFCNYCGGGQHLVSYYNNKQQKWIKQGYCCHCGKKYDWSNDND